MSLAMAIVLMIGAWLVAAGAMLWGVLRIARRHHSPTPAQPSPKPLPTGHRAVDPH